MNSVIRKALGLGILLLLLSISFVIVNAQTEEPAEEICRVYSATVEDVAVRSCANESCEAFDTLSLGESICVRNTESSWYEVDTLPDNPDSGKGFVLASLLQIGSGEENADDFEYCDAHRVTPEEALVRVCPSLGCEVARTLVRDEVVCVATYGGDYANWIEVGGGINGTSAWVNMTDLSATGGDGSCEAWRVSSPSTVARSCPQAFCDALATLNQGTEICSAGESFEEQLWLGVYNSEGRFGWIYANLVEPTTLASNEIFSNNDAIRSTVEAAQATSTAASNGTTNVPSATLTPLPAENTGLTIVETPSLCSTETTNNEECIVLAADGSAVQAINLPLSRFLSPQVELNSPQSNTSFRLIIPDDWVIRGNNILNLSFTYSETGDDSGVERNPVTRLDIRFDNRLLESLALSKNNLGTQNLQILLPQDLLASSTTRNHLVELELTALDHCEDQLVSRVLIDGDISNIHLEYQENAPIINLAAYPRPFYEGHPSPEIVYLVLPDNPDSATLSSAARVVAGLGAMASDLQLETLTVSMLSDAIYRSNNLILIGQASAHPLIADYYGRSLLPTSMSADNLISTTDGQAIASDDGILQIIPHPEDARFAVLIVTGQSEAALLKAGQALGGQPSVIGLQNNLTIISDAAAMVLASSNNLLSAGMKFGELGYPDDIVLSGIGEQSIFVEFFVPFGVVTGDDAFINLLYNSSAVLEQLGSTLTVSVNDIPIASTILSPQTDSDNPFFSSRTLQASIPATAILPGRINYMTITLNTQEMEDCQPYDNVATWLTIGRESEIFLPISLNEPEFPLVGYFPAPFNLVASLSELVIAVPDNPSIADINQAMDIVHRLGSSALDASGINPQIVKGFSEEISWEDYHLIVLGRPSTNSFLNELADDLPQPFVTGTDELQQIFNNVTYRLNEGYDVGLLEVIESPYNAERTVLVITGTNENTQALAASALSDERFSFPELAGDVVFISEGVTYPINSQAIAQSFEILQAVPLLATESAMLLQSTSQPLTEVAGTQFALIPTTTPFATPTDSSQVNENTAPIQETAILVIESTEDAIPVNPIEPLRAEDLETAEAEQPAWVQYLIIMTIVASIGALLYLIVPRFLKQRKN